MEEGFYGAGDVLAIPLVVAIFDNVGEGSEGLHEALGGALVEEGGLGALV